jgi:CheY-like chemotaxis protein
VVRLPLDAETEVAGGPALAGDGAPARPRVLVIEDDLDIAISLKAALEIVDHAVEVARDGREGLAKARAFRPDIVLCDIGLPGMDGYEVARAFRADDKLRATFLVALSGYAQAEDIARARAAGFDHHLAKPASLDAISEVFAARPGGYLRKSEA